MSKKVERTRRYFSKKWFAVISGSMVVMTIQTAEARHDRGPDMQQFRHNHQSRRHETGFTSQVNGAAGVNDVRHQAREFRADHVRVFHQTFQGTTNGDLIKLNNGVDLDLSSSATNITLGQNLLDKSGSVTINVGGQDKTVSAGSHVSSAEYIAVKQVLAGGQRISIDANGRAVGGDVDFNSITAPGDAIRAASLVIPENVTTIGAFEKGGEFRLTGSLDNYGSVYALGGNKSSVTVHANDIFNHEGALISSVGSSSHHRSADLNLVADQSFVNNGSIVSGGNLSISAGSSIANTGSVSAKEDVTLNSSTIANSASVSSESGSINLYGSDAAVLNVNNAGGTLSAQNGSINLRDVNYAGTFDTHLNGGDLLSQDFNINAGNASAYVDAGEISGTINQHGLAVHVDSASDVMTLGNICLTGDPTYRNISGSINLAGDITVGEDLVIIAAGDITSSNNVDLVAGDTTSGYNITLIAGANFNAIGGADVTALPPLPASSSVIIGLNSVLGGSIDFGFSNTISARSTDNVGNDAGGNITLVAFAGASPFSGKVDVGNTSLSTGGKNAGANGDVTIIAGMQNGQAIRSGSIDTTGGTGAVGVVEMTTAQPFTSNGGVVTYNASGVLTSVDHFVPGVISGTNATVFIGGILKTVQLTVNSGGTLTSSAAITCSGLDFKSNANIQINNSITSDVTDIDAKGFLSFGGSAQVNSPTILFLTGELGISGTTTTLAKSSLIDIESATGNIGLSPASRFRVDAGQLFITTGTGSAYIVDTNDLALGTSQTAGTMDVQCVDGFIINAASVIVGDVVKLQSTADAISVGGNIVGGSTVSLRANTDLLGTGKITGQNLFMTADSASIGSIATPMNIDVDNIVVSAPLGLASVHDTSSLNFGGGSSFVGFQLQALADLSMTSTSSITGDSVLLGGQTVNITAPIFATSNAGIISTNTINNSNISGGLFAPFVLFNSTNGSVGSLNNPINVTAPLVAAVANNGSVFISAPGALSTGFVGAKNQINITTGSDLFATSNITCTTGPVSIVSGGTINGVAVAVVSGTSVTLQAAGNIGGDAAHRFHLSSSDMTVNTTGDDVFVDNANATAVTLNASSAKKTLDVATTTSNLVSGADFTVPNLFFTAGGSGVFNFTGDLTADTQLSLTSGGTLTNSQFGGSLTTPFIHVGSTGGNVGLNVTNPFSVGAAAFSASTTTGDVNIADTFSGGGELRASQAGNDFNLTAPGNVNIAGNVTAGGTVNIAGGQGLFAIKDSVAISAVKGINLTNNGTNKKSDKMTIGKNVSIVTSGAPGDVVITLGVAGGKAKKPPKKNVQVVQNNGTVTFFGTGATASGPTNTITAKNADVVINNSVGAKNLTLGGGVIITADPPDDFSNKLFWAKK